MNESTKRQATRLLALAAATPVMVVMATGSAGAAPTVKHKLQGVAQTDVVQVSVNVPLGSTLANTLPSVGNVDLAKPLTLGLIHTDGKLVRDQIANVTDDATSTSTLGAGTLFDKGGLLAGINQSITATLKHTTDSAKGVAFNQAPLQLAAPTLSVNALRNKVDNTLKTHGQGELAGLTFANLAQLLPAGALDQLNSQLSTLIGSSDGSSSGVTGTIVNQVDTLLNKIDQSLQTTPVDSVTHKALTTLQKELQNLADALPKLVATLESGSVVDLKALDSEHTISTGTASDVTSTAKGALAHLSLLGGFVTLDGFNNAVKAHATGQVGHAVGSVQPNLAHVQVGSPVGLDLVIGPNGLLTGSLLGTDLPTEITGLVNQLVGSISDILSVAGVKIAAAKYTTTYFDKYNHVTTNKAQAQSVAVNGSGLQVLVNNPLDRNNNDFTKALVGVKVGAVSAMAGNFAAASNTPPARVIPQCTKACGPLPHTGANLPVTAGAAMVFMAGAYFVRRRFRSTEV